MPLWLLKITETHSGYMSCNIHVLQSRCSCRSCLFFAELTGLQRYGHSARSCNVKGNYTSECPHLWTVNERRGRGVSKIAGKMKVRRFNRNVDQRHYKISRKKKRIIIMERTRNKKGIKKLPRKKNDQKAKYKCAQRCCERGLWIGSLHWHHAAFI